MIHQLEILIQDLRYAGRTTHRSPGFAAVVILSMALGIGANSAIFNLVDTLMLRSLPVKDPQQLVILANDTKWSSFSSPLLQAIIQRTFSYPAYTGFRDSNHVLSGIFAVQDGQRLSARIDGQNEIVTGLFSSASFYSVLGVGTAVGRPMLSDDERPNADTVCVISYGYWERRFGRDPGVLSKTIYLNGKPGTIVGVTLQGFYGLDAASTPPDIAIPITKYDFINDDNRLASRTNGWLQIIGRLRPGIPTQQAIADLDVIYHSIQQEAREESKKPGDAEASEKDFAHIQFQPGARGMSYLGAMYSNSLLVLMAAVGLVLLIACSNVASLLLARATWRQKEMAVRSAIGAGRWRLMRQLLTESVLLAMIGGGLGVIFCFWGSRFLLKFIFTSDEIPRNLQAGSAVLWFALLLSVITGMVFGLAPALRSTRFGLASTLKENSANVAGASKSLLGKTLVVGQVALSLVLLIAAGLLVRSFQRLKSVELGFRPDGVIVAQTDADLLGYKGERLQAFYKNILDKARTIPGAVSATLSEPSPIGGGESVSSFSVPGQPEDANNQTHITQIVPAFFRTLGIRMMSGRDFTERDDKVSPLVAIVNQKFSHDVFGDADPLGKKIQFGRNDGPVVYEIVGVAADSKYSEVQEAPTPMVYQALFQSKEDDPFASLEVRTEANVDRTIPFIRDAVKQVDSNVTVQSVRRLRVQVDDSLSEPRLIATLCSFFGLFALVLACIGLYGLISYSVARRTNEIGVRMALGANRAAVVWLIAKETLSLVAIGAVIGLAVSLLFSKLLASLLFNLGPRDPIAFAGATLVLALVALLAGSFPARRASQVDPLSALRFE